METDRHRPLAEGKIAPECAEPGCTRITRFKRCTEHRRARRARYKANKAAREARWRAGAIAAAQERAAGPAGEHTRELALDAELAARQSTPAPAMATDRAMLEAELARNR